MTLKQATEKEVYGFVHSFEPVGTHDGPGLRSVVFLSGCPMRCKYCHNPDALSFGGGERKSARQVAERCLKDRAFTSGVTLSGGEPLAQGEFTREILRLLRKKRVHTALDTAGSVYDEAALELAGLVILDIKHTDEREFEKLCGYKMDNTLKTLQFLKRKKIPFWIRQVIVPNITDGSENLKALASLSFGAEKVELLPYHTMGVHKWEKLNMPYPLAGVKAADSELMQKCNAELKEYINGIERA